MKAEELVEFVDRLNADYYVVSKDNEVEFTLLLGSVPFVLMRKSTQGSVRTLKIQTL